MYAIKGREARNLVQNHTVEKEEERHYLFGRNGIYSFEEDGCVYSVVERNGERFLVQDTIQRGKIERTVTDEDISDAINFLKNMGYEPFMRLDIERHIVEDGEKFLVEKVDQLGYFTDNAQRGGREVVYGELLKEEMKTDQDKRKVVKGQAEKILQKN